MKIKEFFAKFFEKFLFGTKWRCNLCGREIFDGEYFCEDCIKTLPFNDGAICSHCGRKTILPEEYCLTCKGNLTSIDKGRSCFNYEGSVRKLITGAKYYGKKYLLEVFSEYLYSVYCKNLFAVDYLTYIPMTTKAQRKRGYNKSKVLCELLSEKVSVPVFDGVVKKKETKRQAKLDRSQRLKNLDGAFRIEDKKVIKGKSVLIVDDVTTTGATAEAMAKKLKSAGASKVYLITVASVGVSNNKIKKRG